MIAIVIVAIIIIVVILVAVIARSQGLLCFAGKSSISMFELLKRQFHVVSSLAFSCSLFAKRLVENCC